MKLLILLLLGSAATAVSGDEAALKQQIVELKAQNRELQERIKAMQAEIQQLKVATAEIRQSAASQLEKIRQEQTTARAVDANRYLTVSENEISTRQYKMTFTHGTRQKHVIRFTAQVDKANKATNIVAVVQTAFTGTIYKKTKQLTFQIGEQELAMPVLSYNSVLRRVGGRSAKRIDDETIRFKVSAAQLKALAMTARGTGRIGPNRFEIMPGLLAAAAALHQRLDRQATSPSKP